jgi:alpha-tubulin suppressor-like RCC1 family protein
VQVEDSEGETDVTTVDVRAPLSISPLSIALAVNNTAPFSGVGGIPPYSFSLVSGSGSIDASTGLYTAPALSGTDTVRVTDSLGFTADAVITVNPALQISPATRSIPVNRNVTFSATGGVTPYTFSIASGGGSIDAGTGAYTSPATQQMVTVRVTDAYNNTSDSSVEVVIPIGLFSGPAAYVNCLKFSNLRIKCWGAGGSGRLGQGNTANRGSAANQLGESLPYIDLGTGFLVDQVAVGGDFACATNSAGQLKCWGENGYGQLGLGNTADRGDAAGEMGDALPYVNLGSGRTVLQITAGQQFACALLDNQTIKCWGRNQSGQLGQGSTLTRGDGAGEMGDALAVTSLSTTALPTGVFAGFTHACATLDNGTSKCWGAGTNGRLGQGNTTTRGDGAGEMGDTLAVSALGSGLTATHLHPGNNYTCARLDSSEVKCWGAGNRGQLLRGNTVTYGDGTGEMGDSLPVLNFGSVSTVNSISISNLFGCALLTNDAVKCWGEATYGQLGNGSTTAHLGDAAGELGDSLPTVNLGTGLTPSQIVTGYFHACALFDDHRLKCWGRNNSGQLGLGNTQNRGDAAGEMGDSLPFVPY